MLETIFYTFVAIIGVVVAIGFIFAVIPNTMEHIFEEKSDSLNIDIEVQDSRGEKESD